MKRGRFQGFADTLPRMLVGDRIRDDLELLVALPDGEVTLDLVSGQALHRSPAGECSLSMRVASDLGEWLKGQLRVHDIPEDSLQRAVLSLGIRTDRVPTVRPSVVSLDLECHAHLAAGDKEYRGSAVNHIWHDRTGRIGEEADS